MKKILMIATGGTIAAVPSEDGLVPSLTGRDIINLLPSLKDICIIDTIDLMNIDSSNLSPRHWIMMIETIEKNYDLYDGFVITHGTDTMTYSSSFLSCAITNLGKPVVFTGSQLPINVEGGDGKDNVYHAFVTACSQMPGVFIVFNGNVHIGDYVRKNYTENFIGYSSVNREIAATFCNNCLKWNIEKKRTDKRPAFNKTMSQEVFVLKMIPSLKPDIIGMLVDAGYKAIVIEGYGAGGVPTAESENNFLPEVQKAIDKGVAIACTTQCLYDGVHLDKYPMGIFADRHGAISCKDMTLEKALVKLMLGLAKNMSVKELKEYIEAD